MPQAITSISHHCLFWVGTELVGSVWPIYANKCSNPLNQTYAKYKVEPILPIWVTVVAMELWFCYCCVKAAWEVIFPIFAFLEKSVLFCEAHEGQKCCSLLCHGLCFFQLHFLEYLFNMLIIQAQNSPYTFEEWKLIVLSSNKGRQNWEQNHVEKLIYTVSKKYI